MTTTRFQEAVDVRPVIEGEEEWESDSEATTEDTPFGQYLSSFPQVNVVEHPHPSRNDRVLVAARPFSIGEVILTEAALLHTVHSVCKEYPSNAFQSELPLDFEILCYEFIRRRVEASVKSDVEELDRLELVWDLSADGILSSIAMETDPERLNVYLRDIKGFLKTIRKQLPKPLHTYLPTSDELLELLGIIETNNHSEMIQEESTVQRERDDTCCDEHCGLYLIASMMEHSCSPNAITQLDPTSDRITLIATKPITAGDHITISYADLEYVPRHEREAKLRRRGFVCRCSICEAPDACQAIHCQAPECRGVVTPMHDFDGGTDIMKCTTCAKSGSQVYPDTISGDDLVAAASRLLHHLDAYFNNNNSLLTSPSLPLLSNLVADLVCPLEPLTTYHYVIHRLVSVLIDPTHDHDTEQVTNAEGLNRLAELQASLSNEHKLYLSLLYAGQALHVALQSDPRAVSSRNDGHAPATELLRHAFMLISECASHISRKRKRDENGKVAKLEYETLACWATEQDEWITRMCKGQLQTK
ncbi:hypothetical protein BC832DRAFT_589329 [Gaertneriomyces semiglobifer]|nr:hypothetical protein BC832DRAFT_589329 [Gaertneriomyces semiglobifer]